MTDSTEFHQPQTWDRFAQDYEALAEPFTGRMAIALAELVGVQPDEEVVDIACGPGALSLHLARHGARVQAIDHSPAMVERLLARARDEGLVVGGEAMDGQALTFADGRFDAALSAFGIFLFPDNEAGLREAVRVLRPGGRLGLATWKGLFGAGPSLLIHEAAAKLFPDRQAEPPSAGAAAWGDPDRLAAALAAAGLEDVRVSERSFAWTFSDASFVAERAEQLFQVFPLWNGLDQDERERLSRHITDRLSAMPEPAVPSTALLATGRKPA